MFLLGRLAPCRRSAFPLSHCYAVVRLWLCHVALRFAVNLLVFSSLSYNRFTRSAGFLLIYIREYTFNVDIPALEKDIQTCLIFNA